MPSEVAVQSDILQRHPELPAPAEAIFRMRQAVLNGQHWFPALLEAVGSWRAAQEQVGERTYRYLLRGEAFDWLLLAERLVDEMADLVPRSQAEALVFEARWPMDLSDEEFAALLGPAKHSAHLNYLYGVLVEEALQLAVEEEIHKENRCQPWGQDDRVDETMYERVYGAGRLELCARYYEETGERLRNEVSLSDWQAFIYWLFRLRLRRQDKARVASDTRKGLAQLTRMEHAVRGRRYGARLDEDGFAARYGG